MNPQSLFPGLGFVVVLGSAWGLAEAGLGLALESCARFASGSIMAGAALFFLAAARRRTGDARGPLLAVLIAAAFKLFDAALLGLPVRHGAVANPIFAFAVEGLAFVLLFGLFRNRAETRPSARFLLGGTAALAASVMSPAAKMITGIPACVLPGTNLPLALVFAPAAAAVGALAVPLAWRFAAWAKAKGDRRGTVWSRVAPAAAALAALLAVAVLRLV